MYEDGADEEYSEFYDFSSAYEDIEGDGWEDVGEEAEADDAESSSAGVLIKEDSRKNNYERFV